MTLRHLPLRAAAVGGVAATVLALAPFAASAQAAASASAARSSAARSGATRLNAAQAAAAGASAGSITGVIDGFDGTPLAGVCVIAAGPSGRGAALTSATGRYLITGLRAGRYLIRYQDCRPGNEYLPASYGPFGRAAPVLVAGPLPVTLRAVTLLPAGPAARLRLARAAEQITRTALARTALARTGKARTGKAGTGKAAGISGVARNAAGHGVPGICVSAEQFTANSVTGWSTITGPRGGYRFPVPPGPWQVSFTSGCGRTPGYAPQWWKYSDTPGRARTLHVTRTGGFTGIDASLKPGAAIAGVVHAGSSTGPGLPGVCVLTVGTGAMSGINQMAVTGANGAYQVIGLGAGGYQVQFQPGCGSQGNYVGSGYPGHVQAADGKTTGGIDGYLPVGATITGRVTAAATGKPVAGICVFAVDPSGNALSVAFDHGNGRYRIRPIAAGRFRIEYLPCGFGQRKLAWYYGPRVQVGTRSAVSGVNAALPQGGMIAGKVLAGSPAVGQPGICVEEVPVTGHGLARVVVTAAGGRYSLGGLAPGTYQVLFTPNCLLGEGDFVPQWYSGAASQARAATVTVTAGATTSGIGGTLSADGGISGTVTAGGRSGGGRVRDWLSGARRSAGGGGDRCDRRVPDGWPGAGALPDRVRRGLRGRRLRHPVVRRRLVPVRRHPGQRGRWRRDQRD